MCCGGVSYKSNANVDFMGMYKAVAQVEKVEEIGQQGNGVG